MSTKQLTMRSKITVRWTTNPGDMGYDGNPSDWESAPGKTMSLRRAAGFSYELSQLVGQGTFKRIQYSNAGRIVSLDEIKEVIAAQEYALYRRNH
ncbi:hypothetical protein [Halothiobacillus sp.]|uniref:hypothetical protein n=1 Tax=Halothiobacillus sp. TaxID=1891311 RepID=UPI0019861557|nr:hypothetical protein [Halothiobacillus sp.]MBC7074606.1 hypothetical protein [Syntrophomonadaceae bacterium]